MTHRDTIFIEDANILERQAQAGNQVILRLHAPEIAAHALPGQFVHIQCDPALPMRRPLSLMRVNAKSGWVDILFKVLGTGTRLLSQHKTGDRLSVMGPIGKPFESHMKYSRPLLIGGGVGMPPMVFLADALREVKGIYQPFVIMGSEVPFPFKSQPSKIMVPGVPNEVIAAMPLMDDWGIASRLASQQGYPGCFEGYVTDLARSWLDALSEEQRKEVAVFACGPHPMLEAVAQLAREYRLPCQVSLEEFMACAVGGCAGCTVEVQTASGPAMKRVCVDGPVFDAKTVFPPV
ncbi:MAG TPA: dihydroorotate dehydrogenase electron transfer subunit [Gammaproteobacteria bacterium]|nr:dihydroorotate dehydrogenase electron transfer subunit [Gammaproteobacteria bacterium]